jgi:hypothetical protein
MARQAGPLAVPLSHLSKGTLRIKTPFAGFAFLYLKIWADKRQGAISPSMARNAPVLQKIRDRVGIGLAFFRLQDLPALKQPYDQHHQGDDQEHVHQAADVEREKSQGPEDKQNNQNCFQHVDLPFGCPISRAQPYRPVR